MFSHWLRYCFSVSADIEVSNRHGHTCLMIACYKGHYKIANFLLSLKADINKKSVKGNTALHDCAESGSLDIFKMLILNGAKMEVDSYGECDAVKSRNSKNRESLIQWTIKSAKKKKKKMNHADNLT